MARVIGVMVALATGAFACDVFPPTVKVQSNFDIVVTDHGEPVSGVPVIITRMGVSHASPVMTALSDAKGRIPVRDLSPGDYAVTSGGAIQVPGFIASVSPKNTKTEASVELQWPDFRLVKVKHLAGRLKSADPLHPFAEVEIELLNLDGSEVRKLVRTGSTGRFQFDAIPPGVYVLRVWTSQPGVPEDWQVHGPIAVEVMPDSYAADSMDLPLGESSCGIFYAQCDVSAPIAVSAREVRVADPNGAAIRSAHFRLEDDAGHIVASGASDAGGVASLPQELHGAYKLTIFSTGFTPFEIDTQFVTPDRNSKPLDVSLDVGGACSHLRQEKHATP